MARTALFMLTLMFLAACGRELTPNETDFARALHGSGIDAGKVRLVRGAPLAPVTFRYPQRPRTTCRERMLPPVTREYVTTKPAAMTLFNHVLFTREWYSDDFMADYPGMIDLVEAMLLGHELTHVWQWQNRSRTGYSPLAALREHRTTEDPYLFEIEDTPDFLDYGFEQQGAVVEEYICCRALAPKAARTQRLHEMLSRAFPVSDLPGAREHDVLLPWSGAEVGGICD